MKLQVMSDLHFEFHADRGKSFVDGLDPSGVDALVLAGDIHLIYFEQEIKEALSAICAKYPKVFYVLGNHEFYKSSTRTVVPAVERIAKGIPNLEFLDNRVVEFKGHRILGSSLWFGEDPMVPVFRSQLSDFFTIKDFTPWVFNQFVAARKFLFTQIEEGDIVITHHLPSNQSVPPEYRGSGLNIFFVGECEDIILDRKPALWIHGHTHGSCDYMIDKTRVVCNPLGYPRENRVGGVGGGVSNFNEKKIVEV